MNEKNTTISKLISSLMEKANSTDLIGIRLQDWKKVIEWQVDDISYFWVSNGNKFLIAEPTKADFVIKVSSETLLRLEDGSLPFFIGLWGTGDVQFDGSFSDAYRLGYVFLSDKRERRVIFISHCWLNINTRFPEGCAFKGANVPLIQTLLDAGLGIIQMPCPEYECLGLEKWDYGVVVKEELRACFRKQAEIVLNQIIDYRKMGFNIVGIMGMDPSPSCGVNVAKGKGTMLGTDRDTSEKPEPGIFIEELKKLLEGEGIADLPFFAMRRTLTGESDLNEKLDVLKTYIQ